MTGQSKKYIYCFLTESKSSSCELKSFQLNNFPWARLLLRSQQYFLRWVLTMKIPSQPPDIFVSWNKYLLTLWEHLIVESFFQGVSLHKTTKTSNPTPSPPQNDEIAQKDNRNQERWVHFLYFIEKKVKFYFVERFYSTLF